jgi:hypothetical protein
LHDALQAAVPASRRLALHVNLVVHGQRICLPRIPLCSGCPLLATCPKVGVRVGTAKYMPAFLGTLANPLGVVASAKGNTRQ